MGGHDRLCADVECIVESLYAGMRNVDHHTYPVHFMDDLFAESIHAQVLFIVSARTAKMVVAVVSESHVHYAPMAEAFHVCDILADGIAVFDT